jgi:hypothetical protein
MPWRNHEFGLEFELVCLLLFGVREKRNKSSLASDFSELKNGLIALSCMQD